MRGGRGGGGGGGVRGTKQSLALSRSTTGKRFERIYSFTCHSRSRCPPPPATSHRSATSQRHPKQNRKVWSSSGGAGHSLSPAQPAPGGGTCHVCSAAVDVEHNERYVGNEKSVVYAAHVQRHQRQPVLHLQRPPRIDPNGVPKERGRANETPAAIVPSPNAPLK